MKKLSFLLVAILFSIVSLFTTSCSSRMIDFTVISTKSHQIKFDRSKGIKVEGVSYGFLGIGSSMEDALDEALESAGTGYDLLIDGVVRYNDYFFVSGYKITGLAVNSRELIAQLGEKGYEKWCKNNEIFVPDKNYVIK